ncbi:MAG: diapolycopene oxygenase [Algoriphagus sp.]
MGLLFLCRLLFKMLDKMPKVSIIGSGIAGLAASIRMRAQGYEVTVFESNSYPGGKLHNLELDGYRFDTGPSLFTMPHLVDELFSLLGESHNSHFQYIQKETICNYFWEDGTRFSVKKDRDDFLQAAEKTFDVSREILEAFLVKNKKKYDLTAHIFLEKSLHKWGTYLSAETLKSFIQSAGLDVFSSLHGVNSSCFKDPKLIQLFDRYATYNGSSPYKTPGIMSMIPHLEMHYGTFLPKGGMTSITSSLYDLATRHGVSFKFNEPVLNILHGGGKVEGLETTEGIYESDSVISNADVFTSYQNLLKDVIQPVKILEQERSSSALIFYWGIAKEFPKLDLHNIFFSEAYKEEFRCIFEDKSLSDDPTVYINITSKEELEDAPEGCENWFVMINTPGNYDQDWDSLIAKAKTNILKKLTKILDIDIASLIRTEAILDPRTIESQTKSHRGSLYGASSNSKFSAFLRHPNFTSKLKGLYFCGGSVHPGGGIPLCLLSAKIVSNIIKKDYIL